MTYAFLLLAALAVITWSLWSGVPMPDVQVGTFDTAHIQERARAAVRGAGEHIQASIRGAIRNRLHDAVDETLPQ